MAHTAAECRGGRGAVETRLRGEVPPIAVTHLPKNRLLILDVFPNETVEFDFAPLTAGIRSAIQEACGFSEPTKSER